MKCFRWFLKFFCFWPCCFKQFVRTPCTFSFLVAVVFINCRDIFGLSRAIVISHQVGLYVRVAPSHSVHWQKTPEVDTHGLIKQHLRDRPFVWKAWSEFSYCKRESAISPTCGFSFLICFCYVTVVFLVFCFARAQKRPRFV